MVSPMDTRWEKNDDGDLIYVGSGQEYWRTISHHSSDFPMTADKVAALMNHAFQVGAEAKRKEIVSVLGIKA